MPNQPRPLHVSLVAVPEAMVSTVSGLYDVLNSMLILAELSPDLPDDPVFLTEIVAETSDPVMTASGLAVPGRPIREVARTDIIIVPSLMPEELRWVPGRHPELVRWLKRMHGQGAVLASACTGLLLLAETGLFDGREATLHPQLLETCRSNFPDVELRSEHILVVDGEREDLVTSGGTTTWHDLILYLIARYAGPAAAVEIARFFALKTHDNGQALYSVFVPQVDHGDAMVREAQEWLSRNFAVGTPVERMVERSGTAPRTFKRRFRAATGHTPMDYVQRLRVGDAKRRLERTRMPVDEIGAAVGYHDPAFFRRLFKRLTHVTPAVYRQQMRLPEPHRQLA